MRRLTADEFDQMSATWEKELDAKVAQFSSIQDPVEKACKLFTILNRLPADACHMHLNTIALTLCKGESMETPEELYRWAVDWVDSPVNAYIDRFRMANATE